MFFMCSSVWVCLRLPLQAQIPLISQVLMILLEKLDRGGMRSGNIPLTQWDHRRITVISIEIRVPVQQFSVSGPPPFACSAVCPPVTEVQTHVGCVALYLCVLRFGICVRSRKSLAGKSQPKQGVSQLVGPSKALAPHTFLGSWLRIRSELC